MKRSAGRLLSVGAFEIKKFVTEASSDLAPKLSEEEMRSTVKNGIVREHADQTKFKCRINQQAVFRNLRHLWNWLGQSGFSRHADLTRPNLNQGRSENQTKSWQYGRRTKKWCRGAGRGRWA